MLAALDPSRAPLGSKRRQDILKRLSRWLADWREDEPAVGQSSGLPGSADHTCHLSAPNGSAAARTGDARLVNFEPAACCGNNLRHAIPSGLARVLHNMTAMIDRKDPYTCGHSDRVARLAVELARELGWRPDQLIVVHLAGLLHDIGKIGVEAEILRKPGGLTAEEYEQVKSHPRLGHELLLDVEPLAQVLPAVLYHHERWDGGGYPSGLSGDDIPEIARVVAVADAYDAMTSERPYRSGLPRNEVQRIFQEGLGRHWDPLLVDAFLQAEPCFRCTTRPVGSIPLVALAT
jgi:putative nucleotidyltransferase with HDIG domain